MVATVSVGQLTTLIDFMEAHPELALGRCSRSKEGRSLSKRLWVECADILNSLSADCAKKSADQWRVYFNEYKSKLLKKIKNEKSERSATGGGQAAIVNLTPLQDRLYTILGRDVGEPLPGVRHIPDIIEQDEVPGASSEPNNNNMIYGNTINTQDVEIEFIERPEPPPEQPLTDNAQHLANLERKEKEDLEQFKKTKKKKNKKDKENIDESEEPSMREAAASLQRMEQMNADAMLVHATAINRLAAAVELLAQSITSAATASVSARRRPRSALSAEDSDLAQPLATGSPPPRRRRRTLFEDSEEELTEEPAVTPSIPVSPPSMSRARRRRRIESGE